MGCGCRKKAQAVSTLPLTLPCGDTVAPGDLVVIRYVGFLEALTTYRAPSGRRYRFAAKPPYNEKPVAATDAAYFLTMGDFIRGG